MSHWRPLVGAVAVIALLLIAPLLGLAALGICIIGGLLLQKEAKSRQAEGLRKGPKPAPAESRLGRTAQTGEGQTIPRGSRC